MALWRRKIRAVDLRTPYQTEILEKHRNTETLPQAKTLFLYEFHSTTLRTMPWQMAPGLLVITGAFSATGFLLRGVDNLAYGRNRRVQINEWEFNMDKRDVYLKGLQQAAIEDEKRKAAEAASS